jgi:hypothetical protein
MLSLKLIRCTSNVFRRFEKMFYLHQESADSCEDSKFHLTFFQRLQYKLLGFLSRGFLQNLPTLQLN